MIACCVVEYHRSSLRSFEKTKVVMRLASFYYFMQSAHSVVSSSRAPLLLLTRSMICLSCGIVMHKDDVWEWRNKHLTPLSQELKTQ
jgi:hypothetical protein